VTPVTDAEALSERASHTPSPPSSDAARVVAGASHAWWHGDGGLGLSAAGSMRVVLSSAW